MGETAAEKLARMRARYPHLQPRESETEAPVHDPDLIPDIELSEYERTEVDDEVDKLVDRVDIIDAYRRWCGKMEPKIGNKRESIMISCPRPDHRDANPSAWINLDKQTWYCAKCDDGGDTLTLIARTKGLDGDSYQQGKTFPDLKRGIAEDLGYVIRKTPGGEQYLVPVAGEVEKDDSHNVEPASLNPHSDPDVAETGSEQGIRADVTDGSSALAPVTSIAPDEPPLEESEREAALSPPAEAASGPDSTSLATVTTIYEGTEGTDDDLTPSSIPPIVFEELVKPETFLYEWMSVMCKDDLPNEFYFWHGLTALGMAVGRDAVLMDRLPVLANLYTCMYGPSGQGKSRSTSHLTRLLREALPYDASDAETTGAKIVPMPGSPEALIDEFSVKKVDDDGEPDGYAKVRGFVRFDELSTLIGRATRSGNPIKPILQQFYDGDPLISTVSRGTGSVEAHDSFCSVTTTTQPRAIRAVLMGTDVDSGFANRWVYVMGHSKPPISFGGASLDIDVPVEHLRSVHAWASFGRQIGMTEDAFMRWDEFYHETLAQFHDSEDSMTSRIPLLCKKLVLLFAINAKEDNASLDTIETVISLFPYIEATYKFLSGDVGVGIEQDQEAEIIRCIKDMKKLTGLDPTPRDLLRRLPKRLAVNTRTLRGKLSDMCALGVIEELAVKPEGRGRPTVRYKVVEG